MERVLTIPPAPVHLPGATPEAGWRPGAAKSQWGGAAPARQGLEILQGRVFSGVSAWHILCVQPIQWNGGTSMTPARHDSVPCEEARA